MVVVVGAAVVVVVGAAVVVVVVVTGRLHAVSTWLQTPVGGVVGESQAQPGQYRIIESQDAPVLDPHKHRPPHPVGGLVVVVGGLVQGSLPGPPWK